MDQSNARATRTTPRARRQGVLKDRVGKLALLAVSTGICLVLLELVIRAVFPFFSPRAQIPFHASIGNFMLGPASQQIRQTIPKGDYDLVISFNKYGFRDPKDLRNSSDHDIFVVGDSFSLGWGVQEGQRYSNLLQGKLGLPVYNIAIPEDILGYARLREYAQSCGAKVRNLIIGVCMENDLRDYSNGKTLVEMSKESGGAKSSPVLERARCWLHFHSALYVALSFTLQKNAAVRGLLERIGVAHNIDNAMPERRFDESILKSSRDELVKLASNSNAVVLIIPSRWLWHGRNRAEEAKIHNRFVELVRHAGLPVIDMKPVFERNPDALSYYFTSDPHWNPSGHSAAADTLFEYFQCHKIQTEEPESF